MVNRLKKIWAHPWVVVCCNLYLVMFLYSLSRLFFYWINIDLYPNISDSHLYEILKGGLRFDLTALLYLNILYILLILLPIPPSTRNTRTYKRLTMWSFLIPNAIGIIVNCVDMVYVRFTDRRTTCSILTEFQNDDNIIQIIWQSLSQYWNVTLFGIGLLLVLYLLMRKRWHISSENRLAYYIFETLILLVTAYFSVIGIRGGFGKYTRPITISNALQYANTPQETAIILNTPFSLIKSLEHEQYTHPHYYDDQEVETLMTPIHEGHQIDNTKNIELGEIGKTNVVILILESFSKEYIGYYNQHLGIEGYKGYTPFLDSLLKHCVTYTHSFASGRKSIDAMPSILSSIPMLIEPYIVTPYSTNEISSIAACLRQEGYYTAFFHGAPNGSMGFQAFAKSADFEDYFGLNEYDGIEAFDGTWAIWDEEFLQYYARSMNSMEEPFMTTVFTASSHHPFRVPEVYKGRFEQGSHPIHQCIGYTDYALQRFFEYAQQQSWYDNTLFVLTADHTNELSYAEYSNAKGIFEVPIAFYSPRWNEGKLEQQGAVSQTDIMPSILSYLQYKNTYFAFGEDILTTDKKHPYAICYNHPVYQLFSDSILIQYDGKDVIGVYNYLDDKYLENNIIEQINIDDMIVYLKAYIQQYIHRITTNQLTVTKNGSTSR